MGDSKFGALVILIVVGFLVGVAPAALADGAQTTAVTDESITVDYQNTTSVAENGVSYNASVTITADGTTLSEGTDYDWNATTGAVTWYNTSSTSDGQEALIDYGVDQLTDESRQLAQISKILLVILALIFTLIMGMTAIKWGGGI